MNIVVAYRSIPHAPGWAAGDRMAEAFEALGHQVTRYASVYRSDEWVGEKRPDVNSADLILYMECCDADSQYTELREANVHDLVYWEFDTGIHRNWSRLFIDYMGFRRVYTANHIEAEKFGTRWLPYAVDTRAFDGDPDCESRTGAAIIGTPFGPRADFAQAAGVQMISGVYAEDYVNAIRGLAMHVHHLDSGGDGLVVARPFETMACGTLLVAPRTNAMNRLFQPWVHYVPLGDNPGEVKRLVRGKPPWDVWIPSGRWRQIARTGRRLVRRKHTWECRARRILADMGAE